MNQNKLMALLAAVALGACAARPADTGLLAQARADYMAAQGNPAVPAYAALEFSQAGAALEQANAAAARGATINQVDQLAYVARQKVAAAQEVAKQKTAEAAVADTARQRDQLRLQQRTQEADQARQQARSAQSQAQNAQAAVQTAQARSAELEAQLAELAAQKTARGLVVTLGDVLFASGQAQLTPGGLRTVRKLADVLVGNPQRTVLVEGYTDSTGSPAHNMALSQRRAEAVRNALMETGVARERIATAGYGEAFPVAGNDNAGSRQLNRRVEIVLSEEGVAIPARR